MTPLHYCYGWSNEELVILIKKFLKNRNVNWNIQEKVRY
jgi:hypothetical protein